MPGTGPTVRGVQRLRVYTEAAGAFATDHTGTLGDFVSIPMKEGSGTFTLDREMIDPGQVVQYQWDYREEILGKKKWTLTFTMPFAPTGTAAGSATAAVQGALGVLLKAIMGGETLGTGSTFSTGWSASTGDVGSGTGFLAGGCVGWDTTTYEMRELESVATNTLTTKIGFSGSPANTNVAYAAATYYLTPDPDTSLQFIVEGYEQTDRWLLLGGQGSFTIALPIGDENAIGEITFNLTGVNWMYGDETAGTLTGSDLAIATYSNFAPVASYAGRCLVQTVGTATYTGASVDISAIAFEPQIQHIPVTSPSGVNGVLRWRVSRQSATPVSGSLTTYFSDFTRFDWRDNKTDLYIFYQVGTVKGNSLAISVPTAQAVNVQPVDANGIASETITFKGRRDSDVGGATTNQALSPVRIHLG